MQTTLKNTLDLSQVDILELIKTGKSLLYKAGKTLYTVNYLGKHYQSQADLFSLANGKNDTVELIYSYDVMSIFNNKCMDNNNFQFVG